VVKKSIRVAGPPRVAAAAVSRERLDPNFWALLFYGVLVTYLPALQGGFVWDDAAHVTRPDLRSWHGLWRIWFDPGATQQYYPLLHSAFWIEHWLWGDAVIGYHLVNVTLHAAAACLVVLIARCLALRGAWLAGFVFALHPVCVESVAWISEQKTILSGCFYLGSALAYLHFDRERRKPFYFLATGLFVLALLTKTVTATLPAALLVVFWWQRGRISWRGDVRPLVVWLALGLSAGLTTAWVERKLIGAEGADFNLSLAHRALLAARVVWFYAAKLVWPANLTFTYPRWQVDPAVWTQYLFPAALLVAAYACWLPARRGRRGPAAALSIFLITLFPVLGFLNVYPFRFSFVADHFQYLACLALIVPLSSAPVEWLRRPAPGIVLVLVLGIATWRQSGAYRDAETLYKETLARNPASWMARNNLGLLLAQNPARLRDAVAEYEAAIRIKPDYPGAHINLGNALQQMPGRLQDAIAEYHAALRLGPQSAEVHNGLGNALLDMPDRLPQAVAEFEAALRIRPDFAEAHNNLGYALSKNPGRLDEAIAQYEAALRLRPENAAAHYNMAIALSRTTGRLPEAIGHAEAAVRIRPDLQPARALLERLQAAR
jgi:tetratricopeptide (TPR) repeat protein